MLFAVVFSEFDETEPLAYAAGNTMEDIVSEFESQDMDFETYYKAGQILIIEGFPVKVKQVSTYTVER
jgi:hypothetical protein